MGAEVDGMNEWTCDGINEWLCDGMNEWMCGGLNEWMCGGMNEWMCEWKDTRQEWTGHYVNEAMRIVNQPNRLRCFHL